MLSACALVFACGHSAALDSFPFRHCVILLQTLKRTVLLDYAGASSDDALSSGDEFYENENFEFMRPSAQAMKDSIPILPSQPVSFL